MVVRTFSRIKATLATLLYNRNPCRSTTSTMLPSPEKQKREALYTSRFVFSSRFSKAQAEDASQKSKGGCWLHTVLDGGG
jgi:hypothetical protein